MEDLLKKEAKLAEALEVYMSEIKKMQMHVDPKSLTLRDIMKKLGNEDQVKFREVMHDLGYEGGDPVWYQK
jgi:hypothetical protein